MKQQLEAHKVIEHSKIVAEQAHQDGIHARQKAEQAKSFVRKEVERAEVEFLKVRGGNLKEAEQVSRNRSNMNATAEKANIMPYNDMNCEYCPQEFSNKKLYEEHITSCPICKTVFKEPPQC